MTDRYSQTAQQQPGIELTILMPCLNEAETLALCVRKARLFLDESGVSGEILIADNGSTDGSLEIAEREGARTVSVPQKGYGSALWAGIAAASGRYVIMGDADGSYDFSTLMPFVDLLRQGNDLVIGNRFRGGIAPGAMPLLHKYLGNPLLSRIGRLFFGIGIGDFHCGLRGFNRDRVCQLQLHTSGMEFASEMIVRSALSGYRIAEVPTTLNKDGRSRQPHLRTWRDGWRHLSFLLMYSPRWLFFYPGVALVLFGIFATALTFPGIVTIGGVGFDIHTFVIGCISIVIGTQSISFSVITRRFATLRGWLPPGHFSDSLTSLTLERTLLIAGIPALLGAGGLFYCVANWASTGFGALQYAAMLKLLILSMTGLTVGAQLALTAFLSAMIDIPSIR